MNFKAVLKYKELGFSIIPSKGNKKPYVKWADFQNKRAETDQLKEWWDRWPAANPAVVTGAISKVTVVDCDSQTGKEALSQYLPESMETPIAKTPKGWHFFFQYQEGISNGVRVLTDCDVRNDGGYIILPPSRNENGGTYTWIDGLKITDVSLAKMPDMLRDVLQNTPESHTKTVENLPAEKLPDWREKALQGVDIGYRNSTATQLAGRYIRKGLDDAEIFRFLSDWNQKNNPSMKKEDLMRVIESVRKTHEKKNPRQNKTQAEMFSSTKDLVTREQTTEKPEPKQPICSVTMSELCEKKFNPIQWLLPDILPIGSTLLAGPPKLGKSVLALNLAVAVATDGQVYGGYVCGTGDVIYLALEDNERRLQTRIKANLNGRPPTDRMQLYHLGSEWPCLGEGCITELRRKIDACTNPKLLIVDTLARVRPRQERRKAQYDLDYNDLSRFHVLTSQYPGLTIIIISHTRKAAADDVFDTISGTQGLSGAVDTLAVMAGFRGKGDAKLIVAGRDVMDVNKALVYEKSTWSWNIAGDAIDIENSEFQDTIFQILKKFDDETGLAMVDIVELSAGKLKKPTVKYNVAEWFKAGIVERVKRGRYRLCEAGRKADTLESLRENPIAVPEYYND